MVASEELIFCLWLTVVWAYTYFAQWLDTKSFLDIEMPGGAEMLNHTVTQSISKVHTDGGDHPKDIAW